MHFSCGPDPFAVWFHSQRHPGHLSEAQPLGGLAIKKIEAQNNHVNSSPDSGSSVGLAKSLRQKDTAGEEGMTSIYRLDQPLLIEMGKSRHDHIDPSWPILSLSNRLSHEPAAFRKRPGTNGENRAVLKR